VSGTSKEISSVQVNISARHGHLSGDTQDKIAEKAEKLRRLFDRVMAIEVIVDLEHRETPSVELRVSAEHVDDFVAIETSSGIMAALDGAIRKAEQQLRKHKERRRDHRSQPLGRFEPREGPEAEQAEEAEKA
jgi:putative sigma-54 modulation protein